MIRSSQQRRSAWLIPLALALLPWAAASGEEKRGTETVIRLDPASEQPPEEQEPGEWELRLRGLTEKTKGQADVNLLLGVGPLGGAGVELKIPSNVDPHWKERAVHGGIAKLVLIGGSAAQRRELAAPEANWEADRPADGPATITAWWSAKLDYASPFLEELAQHGRELRFELRAKELPKSPFVASFKLKPEDRRLLAELLSKRDGMEFVQPRRPGQDDFLTRAVFAEGRLWMRSDAGVVFSVAPGDAKLREEKVPAPALDLCVANGLLHAATRESGGLAVLRRVGDDWVRATSFKDYGSLIGLHCEADTVTVVGTRRILVQKGSLPARAVAISPTLVPGRVMTVHVGGAKVFVGFNDGEWGGGLVRVDVMTGKAEIVDRSSPTELCGGVLNTACDPINGFAASPGKPGCTVAAVGLIHMMAHGRLIEICGDEVTSLLTRQSRESDTVAFYGVVRAGESLVAAGHDGLYRLTGTSVERSDYPAFKDLGGIHVSFDVPGLALVLTAVNSRASVGGRVPLLVPLQ